MRILVTGGVRSGKSRHAEHLLGDDPVCYVAAGPSVDVETDPDWAARVTAHRMRRPASWTTKETRDLAGALTGTDRRVLIDCLGTWLTSLVDEADAWDATGQELTDHIEAHVAALLQALLTCPHDVVVVTNEVGLGVVPEHRSGRLFRDLLGTLNQRVALACDEVHLVVAGRVLTL